MDDLVWRRRIVGMPDTVKVGSPAHVSIRQGQAVRDILTDLLSGAIDEVDAQHLYDSLYDD